MKKPAVRISPRIIEVLEITDALGKSTTSALRKKMSDPNISAAEMCKVCSRAVSLGLLSADRGAMPITYTVVADWRESFAPGTSQARRTSLSFDAMLAAAMAMRPDVRTTWRTPA